MFLSAGFGRSNRRRMTHLTINSEFFHQVQKPLHRSGRFDTYLHRSGKARIKLPYTIAFVGQSFVHDFSRRGVQHRQRLLASMQITSYNPHLGLLRSEHCWGEHRTVYSDRSEADVVMASIRTWATGQRYHFPEALTYASFLLYVRFPGADIVGTSADPLPRSRRNPL